MKKILWKLLSIVDNNWGYTTPLQKRFQINDKCKISIFKQICTKYSVGDEVTIIETGRHDYLVSDKNGVKEIVLQIELV